MGLLCIHIQRTALFLTPALEIRPLLEHRCYLKRARECVCVRACVREYIYRPSPTDATGSYRLVTFQNIRRKSNFEKVGFEWSACTHTHTHTHTLSHARTHTRTRARTHTRTRARTHTLACARTHTNSHAHANAHIHAHTHTRTHARTHALAHTRAHTHTHTHIRVQLKSKLQYTGL